MLLLHGWGCCVQTMASITKEMSKFRTVYALDFPGFGQSGMSQTPMGVADYMELTAEFIRQMGILGTDIINHSFGGRVSILLAAKYPELVGKIVFTDAAGVKPRRTLKYYYKVYFFKLCKKAAQSKFGTALFGLFGIDVQKRVANAGSADYKAQKRCDARDVFPRGERRFDAVSFKHQIAFVAHLRQRGQRYAGGAGENYGTEDSGCGAGGAGERRPLFLFRSVRAVYEDCKSIFWGLSNR